MESNFTRRGLLKCSVGALMLPAAEISSAAGSISAPTEHFSKLRRVKFDSMEHPQSEPKL